MSAYEAGRKNEARKLATALAASTPKFSGAHYLLGLLDLDRDHPRQAVRHLADAVSLNPEQSILHLTMARALEAAGQQTEARLHYRAVLELAPNHAHAHARLGQLLQQSGRTEEAAAHCRAAIAADPAHAEAWNTLGTILLESGDPAQAAQALRSALGQRPSWPAALNNFGLALTRCGQYQEAVAILTGAVDLRPDHVGSRINLCAALRNLNRLKEAQNHAEKAVKLNPRHAAAWLELGMTRRRIGHLEGAAAAFERAASIMPENPAHWFCLAETRRAMGDLPHAAKAYDHCLQLDGNDVHGAGLGLALCRETDTPKAAPAAYVGRLFDDYAARFEASLVDSLGYRGPEIIAHCLDKTLGLRQDLTILDLGCGTGLAGPVLRPASTCLIGLDLSARMLDKAREKAVYDQLHQAEAVAYLQGETEKFDLIAAADVLIYMGDLTPVLNAAAKALKPGGMAVLTLEKAQDCPDYRLGDKLRYAHNPDYVRSQGLAAGLEVILLEDHIIRQEADQPIQGFAIVLLKPLRPAQ